MMSLRAPFLGAALLLTCATIAAGVTGCDVGGLLVVDSTKTSAANPPPAVGPSSMDMVNSGTVASSEKYKLVFSLGQATPNQGPATSADNRLNGGVIGAGESK